MNVVLTRTETGDQGTFGKFVLDDGTTFYSVELPYKENEHNASCVPKGTYVCKWIVSPKHGHCYELQDVPNRGAIEIHIANYGGDVSKGFRSDLLGCIGLGLELGYIQPVKFLRVQRAVLYSKDAITKFHELQDEKDFILTITGV